MTEQELDELEQLLTHPELRFGYVAEIYYRIMEKPVPRQLDMIAEWFGDLIVRIRDTDPDVKYKPEYIDTERIIEVSRYHDYLYTGADQRITQITGRLTGTANSNQEKERKTAELIQKNVSRRLADETEPMIVFHDHAVDLLCELDEQQLNRFHFLLYMFTLKTADAWYEKSRYERDDELYPFDEEVFDQVIYNAFYQFMKYDAEGVVNGWLWLLLGSLLRNACGRLTRTFDSSFVPCFRSPSETGTLHDRLFYLMAPEEYESYYLGDDLDRRFPGFEWYCDHCGEHLNEQSGFDDHLPYWQCRRCGYVNRISFSETHDNTEDSRNDIRNMSEEDFERAIENRRKEIQE